MKQVQGTDILSVCSVTLTWILSIYKKNNKKSETQAGLQTAEHLIFTKNRKLNNMVKRIIQTESNTAAADKAADC